MPAITFGGMVMAIAGVLEFFKGRIFEMMLFLVFSTYLGRCCTNTPKDEFTPLPKSLSDPLGNRPAQLGQAV